MPGRAGYSGRLSLFCGPDLEAALTLLPNRQRRLLRRTEIDCAPHKIVAAELQLSLRQFYRERAAAVRSIVAAVGIEPVHEPDATASIPVPVRMMMRAVSAAIESNDIGRLAVTTETLSLARASLPTALVPFADIVLAAADVVVARRNSDPQLALGRLTALAELMRDLRRGDQLTPLAMDGLAAMLSLAEAKLDGGEIDTAISLARDVETIAVDLTDIALGVRAQTILVDAYLCLPSYTGEAVARATSCVRRCLGTMKPKTIVGSLRALASSLAELGCSADALSLLDVAEPLAATLLAEDERRRHRLWCARMELHCGSPARAVALAASLCRTTPSNEPLWPAAAIIQAHGLTRLGRFQRSSYLAHAAELVGKEHGSRRVVGEAQLAHARNAHALEDNGKAQAVIAAAIPMLDRATFASTQRGAYELSYELTKNPLHAILAKEYRPSYER